MEDAPRPVARDVEAELLELIARSGIDAELRLLFTGDPFETAPRTKRSSGSYTATREPRSSAFPTGPTRRLLAAAGIPTVLFGPSGGGEHETVEWVDLASVERLRDVLLATAQDFCS